ncbi:MAG: hypothetical protein JO264_19225 [Acidisphaera sp.]|nr:hypothetical protein [Acidisphaera sp.]
MEVSVSYVIKARHRRDREGRLTVGPKSFARPRRLAEHEAAIRHRLREQSDGTLTDLRPGWPSHWAFGELGHV